MRKNNIKNRTIILIVVAIMIIVPLSLLLLHTFEKTIFAQDSVPVNGQNTDAVKLSERVDVNSYKEGFTSYAENKNLELSVDEKQAIIRVTDKNSGKQWYSTPPNYESDKLAKGTAKMSLASLLLVKYANRDTNITLQNSKVGSLNQHGVSIKKIDNGVRFDFRFPKEGFVIPLEITLEQDYLKVRVPTEDVIEDSKDYILNTIIPLPYFGAAEINEDGYSFIPDGCGAVIDHKQVNSSFEDYSQYIYNRDDAIEVTTKSKVTMPASLPVFGMKKSQNGFLAIIDNGASRAKVDASVGGSKMSYNAVYSEFIYRDCTIVDISKKTFEYIKLTMFEPEPTKIKDYVMRYYFLNNDQANYTGMALKYQEYLLKDKAVTKRVPANYAPLYIELFGGLKRQEDFLGIPVKKNVPLTTYNDVTDIVSQLFDKGIINIVVNYTNWTENTSENVIPTDLKAESALGSKKEFNNMLHYLKQNNVDIFLDVNMTDIHASGNGINKKFDSTQTVQKNPLMQYAYKYSTYQRDNNIPGWFLLNPDKMLKVVQSISKEAKKYDAAGYSANTMGQKLYSDFGSHHVDRGTSENIWDGALSMLSSATGKSLFETPNAYVFPYATHITDVPIESSKYLFETQEVPFYQIAIHGVIPMTLPAINTYTNNKHLVLKALETGSNLKILAGARNYSKVQGTEYMYLNNIDYQYWINDVVQMYDEVSPVLASVSDQRIVDHQIIQQGVAKTTFENGQVFIVNYTDKDVEVDGNKVKANNYLVTRR